VVTTRTAPGGIHGCVVLPEGHRGRRIIGTPSMWMIQRDSLCLRFANDRGRLHSCRVNRIARTRILDELSRSESFIEFECSDRDDRLDARSGTRLGHIRTKNDGNQRELLSHATGPDSREVAGQRPFRPEIPGQDEVAETA